MIGSNLPQLMPLVAIHAARASAFTSPISMPHHLPGWFGAPIGQALRNAPHKNHG